MSEEATALVQLAVSVFLAGMALGWVMQFGKGRGAH